MCKNQTSDKNMIVYTVRFTMYRTSQEKQKISMNMTKVTNNAS